MMGYIFKDNEGIHAYQYNVTSITWHNGRRNGDLILVLSQYLFHEKICLMIEKRLNPKPDHFGGKLTYFLITKI